MEVQMNRTPDERERDLNEGGPTLLRADGVVISITGEFHPIDQPPPRPEWGDSAPTPRTPEAWPLADEDKRAAEEDAGGFAYGPRPRWQIAAAIVAVAVIVTGIVYTLGASSPR
jgi:hypothetical protein